MLSGSLGGRLFFRLLVRGAVLARSEGVVGKDEEGVGPHEAARRMAGLQ